MKMILVQNSPLILETKNSTPSSSIWWVILGILLVETDSINRLTWNKWKKCKKRKRSSQLGSTMDVEREKNEKQNGLLPPLKLFLHQKSDKIYPFNKWDSLSLHIVMNPSAHIKMDLDILLSIPKIPLFGWDRRVEGLQGDMESDQFFSFFQLIMCWTLREICAEGAWREFCFRFMLRKMIDFAFHFLFLSTSIAESSWLSLFLSYSF